MTTYKDFLASKRIVVKGNGRTVTDGDIHPSLFPFQRTLTRWAVRKGRCAVFADTGLGKTRISLEWARLLGERTLIVAPLSVARQTVREAARIDLDVTYVRDQAQVMDGGIYITNYEMIEHFDAATFGAVVLDESSLLKALDGKTRQKLTDMFADTPYRLCCTATPAPNDISEIANHAEFLGIMSRSDMLATFFVHDDEGWRLKKHAETPFYRWLASWGMSVRKPSDLGDYDDSDYILPPLSIRPVWVRTDYAPDDQLFFTNLHGIQDRIAVRKASAADRVATAIELVNASDEQWIVWCGLNEESSELAKGIRGAVEVKGSDDAEFKATAIEAFQDGRHRVLVTKAKIAGFGMNLQNAHNMAFVGLSDSWEAYYQCIRRSWRFGQTEPVNVYIVLSEAEDAVYQNVMNKEKEANRMSEQLIANVAQFEKAEIEAAGAKFDYRTSKASEDGWTLLLGDSAERLAELPPDSVHLSVFSPPFAQLYVYTATERDLGNSRDIAEFLCHFDYIIGQLLRVTLPGRICAVHVADVPAMLVRDGYIGMKDFSGDVIRQFQAGGWIFDARIPIDKNQQAQAIRTHAKALVKTQLEKDSSWLRPALPDYILKFRKPGDNPIPVRPVASGEMTMDTWIEWANPTWPNDIDGCMDAGAFATWYGIKESDTLNIAEARGANDERHICPLQLGTIERCIKLWSNPGELVLDPFAGIGSTGYEAVKFGRRFLGIELKPEYWAVARRNLAAAVRSTHTATLFDLLPSEEAWAA